MKQGSGGRGSNNKASDQQEFVMTADELLLPSPDTKRWVMRRKAAVILAIKEGRLTLEEACERYNISIEEMMTWRRLIEKHGMGGLRVTRLQEYRPVAQETALFRAN
ncbi:MAG: DUF1153 domain-containing protein [Alphaproteobacteria bacterium]